MKNHANSKAQRLVALCAATTLLALPTIALGRTSAAANSNPEGGLILAERSFTNRTANARSLHGQFELHALAFAQHGHWNPGARHAVLHQVTEQLAFAETVAPAVHLDQDIALQESRALCRGMLAVLTDVLGDQSQLFVREIRFSAIFLRQFAQTTNRLRPCAEGPMRWPARKCPLSSSTLPPARG